MCCYWEWKKGQPFVRLIIYRERVRGLLLSLKKVIFYQNAIERDHKNEMRRNKSKTFRGENKYHYFPTTISELSFEHLFYLTVSCRMLLLISKKAHANTFWLDLFVFAYERIQFTKHGTCTGGIFDNDDDNFTEQLEFTWLFALASNGKMGRTHI